MSELDPGFEGMRQKQEVSSLTGVRYEWSLSSSDIHDWVHQMADYTILESIRVTGEFDTSNDLVLITKRDSSESAEYLDIQADGFPVEIQAHDFEDGNGDTWEFQAVGSWTRSSGMATLSFTAYTSGSGFHEYDVEAKNATTSATEQPPKVKIKIKPVIEAPDELTSGRVQWSSARC